MLRRFFTLSLCVVTLITLSNCTQDASSALDDLQQTASQYGDISALVRNITDTSGNVQMARVNNSNLINALNQLNLSLRYIPDWKEGARVYQQLNTVISTIASPPGGMVNNQMVGQYPNVDTVRTQIGVIQAFVSGFDRYFSSLSSDQLQEYNQRLTQATQILANITAFKSNPGTSASELGQTASNFIN